MGQEMLPDREEWTERLGCLGEKAKETTLLFGPMAALLLELNDGLVEKPHCS